MKKIFILQLCFLSLLFCNEQAGPFKNLIKNKNLNDSFKKEVITLPEDIKFIKQINISFEDNDGNIKTKSIEINKAIDQQDRQIVISSESVFKAASFSYSPILEASLITTPKITLEKIKADDRNVIASQVNVSENGLEQSIKYKLDMLYLDKDGQKFLELTKDGLYIKTEDKILRVLNMMERNRIILDFDKKPPQFKTKTFKFEDNSEFISATVGSHPDYYRFSIIVDGNFTKFETKEIQNGYVVILK